MNVCSLDSNKVEKGGQEGVKEGEKGGRKDGGTEEGQRGRIVGAGIEVTKNSKQTAEKK